MKSRMLNLNLKIKLKFIVKIVFFQLKKFDSKNERISLETHRCDVMLILQNRTRTTVIVTFWARLNLQEAQPIFRID